MSLHRARSMSDPFWAPATLLVAIGCNGNVSGTTDGGLGTRSDAGASARSDAGRSPAADGGHGMKADAGVSAKTDGGQSARLDAGGADADARITARTDGRAADCGALDGNVSAIPYWQWWYPDCGVPAGCACTNPSCGPTWLTVGPADLCSGSSGLFTGCQPPLTWDTTYCYVSSTYDQFVESEFPPYTLEGLAQCEQDGSVVGTGNSPPIFCPDRADGGAPLDAAAGD